LKIENGLNPIIFSDFFGKQNINVETSLIVLNEFSNYIANNSFNFTNAITNQFFENKPLIEIIFERFFFFYFFIYIFFSLFLNIKL
jgi:hypothetical protein